MKYITGLVAGMALLTASPGLAGTLVECRVQALDPSSEPGNLAMYLETDRMRLEFENDKRRQVMVYQKQKGEPVLWLIDDFSSTYKELREKDLKKLRKTVGNQLSELNDQMRELSKTDRDAMKKEFKQDFRRMGEIAKPRTGDDQEVTKLERTRTVGDWECNTYSSAYDGEKEKEFAVATWADLGISYDDVSALVDLHDTFGAIAGDLTFVTIWKKGVTDGFPVHITTYDDGERMDVTEMRAVRKDDFAAYLFELPKGLTRTTFFAEKKDSPDAMSAFFGGAGGSKFSRNVEKRIENCKKPIHDGY